MKINMNLNTDETSSIDYLSTQLIDLQTNVAHLEMTVDTLNSVIAQQDKDIQDLQRQMSLMFKHLYNTGDNQGVAPFDLHADRPPHY